ncbi:MAG: hypothetical protein ACRC8S_16385 [Fimbriiglobus sp.]
MRQPHEQSRKEKTIIAVLVGLSIVAYLLSLFTPYTGKDRGYSMFVYAVKVVQEQKFDPGYRLLIAIWANPMWLASIACYFTKFRWGQVLFALPGLLMLIWLGILGLIWFTEMFELICGWFWAVSLLTAFLAGFLNIISRPRLPRTSEDEE